MNDRGDERQQVPSTGLSILVDPEEPSIDIVFVHGFTGHPERTWSCAKDEPRVEPKTDQLTERSSKRQKLSHLLPPFSCRSKASTVYWPRDLVPLTVPHARVLTYGYDTHIRHRLDTPALQSTVYDIALDFLVALEGERRIEPSRPIVFIVHSLGGIVIKEMLRRSKGCTKGHAHLNKVFTSTKGIIFFGTPHGGADPRGLLHHVAEQLAKAIGLSYNKQIVNTHLPSGERLRELRDEFGPLVEEQGWLVHSFQEQYGVGALRGAKVVQDNSSSLNLPAIEISEHVERNHMEMCRSACNGR